MSQNPSSQAQEPDDFKEVMREFLEAVEADEVRRKGRADRSTQKRKAALLAFLGNGALPTSPSPDEPG